MKRVVLNVGYVPLVDAAPLIIARELGFAAEENLFLNLLRQPSWSALRDLLALGHLDAAHILSPLPIAMTLGLGGIQTPIDALMVLSVNGNVIGVSRQVADKMRTLGWDGRFDTPVATGQALIAATGSPRIGVPFPYSMHVELLHHWLGTTGRPPIQTITIPPPQMSAAVSEGQVDAFCVGEPWGSIAVDQDAGELILPGSAIWNHAPEKVLGARRDWTVANPEKTRGLMRAVRRAGEWLEQPGNRALASGLLADSDYLDLPEHVIDRALFGSLRMRRHAMEMPVPNFLGFHSASTTFPEQSYAESIARRMAKVRGLDIKKAEATARSVYSGDLCRRYLAEHGPVLEQELAGTDNAPSDGAG